MGKEKRMPDMTEDVIFVLESVTEVRKGKKHVVDVP